MADLEYEKQRFLPDLPAFPLLFWPGKSALFMACNLRVSLIKWFEDWNV